MPFHDISDKDLEYLTQLVWDDWNFGSGSDHSYHLMQTLMAEAQRRKTSSVLKEEFGKELFEAFQRGNPSK